MHSRPHKSILLLGALFLLAAILPLASAQSDDDTEKAPGLLLYCDLNHDGIPDLAQITHPNPAGPATLTVSLGQSDHSIGSPVETIPAGMNPQAILTGDFNHDGSLDILIGDARGAITLYTGDGAGHLTAAGEVARLQSLSSLITADFNHDGIPDLAAVDPLSSTVTVLLGNGHGQFQPESSIPLRSPGTSPHLSAADYNGDGIPDLAVIYTNDDTETYDVLTGDGKGHFLPAPRLSVVPDPNAHCIT